MKIYPIVDLISDWYPKNALSLFKQNSSFKFVVEPDQADLVWIFSHYVAAPNIVSLPPSLLRLFPQIARRRRQLNGTPIITTLHHLTPAKRALWEPNIKMLDKVTDYWQTFSKINVPYFKKFISKPIHLLPYWIDNQQFFPLSRQHQIQIRDKYRLPHHKTVIGSFQRDTESNLISPKLEKGPDIFCDIVEQLDRDKVFILLAGPRRDYIQKRLEKNNIPYRNLDKTPFSEMNNLYNALDYYLVTSRHEGGPQAILEAMATRTKIFSTRVGIADLLSPDVIFTNAKQCADLLNQPYPNILSQHLKTAALLSCQNVIPKFERLFSDLVKDYAHTHPVSV